MDTTEIEKQSLEAHVELCAERYRQLEHQLEIVSDKMITLHIGINTLQNLIQTTDIKRNDQLLSWGGSIIAILIATVGWLATHYIT